MLHNLKYAHNPHNGTRPLTSDPLAQVATMALHDRGGALGRLHRRPGSRDISSSSGEAAWHSYRMMCCMNGMLAGESNTGSYCGGGGECECESGI